MATDYDARAEARRTLLPSLWRGCMHPTRAATAQPSSIDMDESDTAEGIELPGADLSGEELNIVVVPIRADEFTYGSCFLVHHRSQLARERPEVLPGMRGTGAVRGEQYWHISRKRLLWSQCPSKSGTMPITSVPCRAAPWISRIASVISRLSPLMTRM
jgi:hypothetical protein